MKSGNCNINILHPQHMNAKVNGTKVLRIWRLGPLDDIIEIDRTIVPVREKSKIIINISNI